MPTHPPLSSLHAQHRGQRTKPRTVTPLQTGLTALCNKVIDLSMLADRMSRRGMEIDMIREESEMAASAPMADFPLVASPEKSLPLTPHPSPQTPRLPFNTPGKSISAISEALGPSQTNDIEIELAEARGPSQEKSSSDDDVAINVPPQSPPGAEGQ
jgi:hypothetical protein